MPKLNIEIPEEIERYAPDIERFVNVMIHKLYVHRNKGHWEYVDLSTAYDLMEDEAAELREAMKNGDVPEIHKEAADIANFAMIISSVARRLGDA